MEKTPLFPHLWTVFSKDLLMMSSRWERNRQRENSGNTEGRGARTQEFGWGLSSAEHQEYNKIDDILFMAFLSSQVQTWKCLGLSPETSLTVKGQTLSPLAFCSAREASDWSCGLVTPSRTSREPLYSLNYQKGEVCMWGGVLRNTMSKKIPKASPILLASGTPKCDCLEKATPAPGCVFVLPWTSL